MAQVKLELGKTYVLVSGKKATCVAIDIEGVSRDGTGKEWAYRLKKQEFTGAPYYWYRENGQTTSKVHLDHVVKEYKEPVIHRRDILWYKDSLGGIFCTVVSRDYVVPAPYVELSRTATEYKQEF